MHSRLFYLKDISKLALPIVMGNIGFIMIGVGDVIVAGRHSTETLAAISIATAITNCLMIFGIGILASISAILSNYRGEGKSAEAYFYPSLKFALILSTIICLAILGFIPVIGKMGFEPNLVPKIKDYFFITAFATFGGYLHCMAKEFLQAFERVIFSNLLTIFCIFLNVGLNIIFAFGFGIIPEMGAKGLALASLITRYFMAIVLIFYCCLRINIKYEKIKNYYKELIKVGLPASLAILVEFTGFNIIALVMGRISGIYAAAHNIITTLTSVSFMIPLAISNAAAVKVGYSNGAKEWNSLKGYANTAIYSSVGFMCISTIFVGLFAAPLVQIFSTDTALINVCIPIVYMLCFFQIFDGLQVALSGIYRGLKNTKIVMISNIISYWIISFPLGCLLGLKFKLNLVGFWIGLCISSVILCTIMYINLLNKFKRLN